MQQTMVATNTMTAYIMRVVVEFFAEGHTEQHSEQAALPKQQATCNSFPIFLYNAPRFILTEAAHAGAASRAPIVQLLVWLSPATHFTS